jgi:alpha-mannosidase
MAEYDGDMIPYSRSVFAVSSASLDDLPSQAGAELAQDYLTAWTSLWDPRILRCIEAVPEWRRSDTSGLDLEDALIVCPELSLSRIDQPLEERLRAGRNDWVPSARRERSHVVRDLLDAIRCRMETSSLVGPEHSATEEERSAAESAAEKIRICGLDDTACALLEEFYAFGYVVLQIQCMARKLRYSFNLDWMILGDQVMNAARASLTGDAAETERWIVAAFDSLSQERDRYCSQQGYLLDLVLTAETTLGPALTQQLQTEHPLSVYATSKSLKRLREQNTDAWQQLQGRLQSGTMALVGGLREERKHAYMTELALARELQQARDDVQELGLEPITCWMRFEPSMTSDTPNLLRQYGYRGALLAALGGGVIPAKEHAKVRWQSHGDGLGLDCILGHVVDASNAEGLLSLGQEMAKQLDYHQVPTLVLAHWPGRHCDAFRDLLVAMKRTPALGKWIDVNQYFATTAQPYWTDHFGADAFRTLLPTQPTQLHQLHQRMVDYVARAQSLERLESVCRLWQLVPPRTRNGTEEQGFVALRSQLKELQCACEAELAEARQAAADELAVESSHPLDQAIERLTVQVLQQLRLRVPGDQEDVVFNPCSHPQRIPLIDIPGRIVANSSTRILAHGTQGDRSLAVIDVPPFGFAKFRCDRNESRREANDAVGQGTGAVSKESPSWIARALGRRASIAEADGTLANEFMEVQIDPDKGHLRSMYVVNKRGNRLSGRLNLVPTPLDMKGTLSESSFMNLQDVRMRVLDASSVRGVLEVSGSLSAPGNSRWTIRYTLWHGSRSLDIEVFGEGMDWHKCYPVWRWVWPSEAASIAAWQNGTRGKLPPPLQGVVELIEIDDVEHKLHIATGGLSFHRRFGHNGLISAFPVRSTGSAHARFAIGMDWPRPWEMAMDRTQKPLLALRTTAEAVENGSRENPPDGGAWLAQCSLPNLRFQWIDPQPEIVVSNTDATGETSASPSGESSLPQPPTESSVLADACLWVVETAGKPGVARVSCIRQVQKAWRVDFRGLEYDRLKVEDGVLIYPFKAWERSRIAICF